MSAPNKKSKTSQEAEIDVLKQYLLECPSVPKDSRALQVTLEALDQERKRMDRDAKLQRKFANTTSSSSSNTETQQSASNNKSSTTASFVTRGTLQQQQEEDDAELMEWQDVAPSAEQIIEARSLEGSVLGKVLAQSAISEMAKNKTTVASPLGAAALALHAALVGETLGFKCTGIPKEEASKGFAEPIRELPKNQLVPNEWDKNSVSKENPAVTLRYRKDGVGSTVLQVSLKDDDMVHVELIPSSTREPHVLTFALKDHVNLDSLSKALAKDGRVVPTLHYKALAVLLTNMCNTFDLGPVNEDTSGAETATSSSTLPYVDTTIMPPTNPPVIINTTGTQPSYRRYDQHEPPNVRIFQPEVRRPGDFDRDLYPGGVDDRATGNLMGPNHPAFGGGVPSVGGGYGMRPRFDPYGPPGGPQDPNNVGDPNNFFDPRNPRRPARPPPGGTGDPNPDHARPPNDLNNNMFM